MTDLIQEIITEYVEQPSAPFPRPGPPPADLLDQLPCSQHSRMHQQSPSQPVLVARGTAHQPNCTFPQPQLRLGNSNEMASAPPSRPGTSLSNPSRRGQGLCLPASRKSVGVSSQSRSDTEMLERILDNPKLVVVEEPKDRGMRFRYECEGRSAGSILGVSSTDTNKTQPAIEIQGPIDHIKRVTVTVSLVTKDPPHRPHPHCLVGKDCPPGSGICVVTVNPHTNRRHSFANLGIQCVRRKELDMSLQKRRSQNIDPFQTGHSKGIEDLDMNAVRLCFQCELEWEDGRKDSLSPVVSSTIYDKKATTTSQLKITCLNQYRGPCTGKTEIYMLCDKVQKDDIEIRFSRGSWKANGEFAQTDVHRQIAIVFKTPPYQDQNITEEVDVNVVLRRISDQMESEPVTFTYLPHNPDPYEVKRKSRIKTDISFREKSCLTAECAPAAEQTFHFPPPQAMMSPDKRLCGAQPVVPAVGEACYNVPQDSNSEDTAILNQLLDNPALWEMICNPNLDLSCDLEELPDGNSTFANVDMNFNQNFSSYPQDFSQFNDLQFNMLVNENQTPQSEPQDSLSNVVQVKKEEAL
ncbi:transcription factor RelB homolog isoform X2 [Lates calcarifer]|uniref:Transcription factor RelB homolog isoform X2 n=1 Tax=Lates calcarifer TaxID=8187 RepID=A0AAJ7QJQ0_LATCA|nr:transcription factor RelB homolog isoform X2 [Lates calcarifer]